MKTIREIRAQQGITQAEMAERLGISRPTYIKIENDPNAMTVNTARRICRLLGCSVEDVFFCGECQD